LNVHDREHTKWQELKPASPFYLFVPRDEAWSQRYQEFMRVTEVFPLNGVGMTTARDEFVIDNQKHSLINRIRLFKHNTGSDDELHRYFSIRRKKGWSIRRAWNMLQELTDTQLTEHVVPVLYRPFDVRWIFYHDSVVWRTVKRVMRHMLTGENLAILASRQVVSHFRHAFVADAISNFNNIDIAGKFGSGYLFPLYLYPSADRGDLFVHQESTERQPNLNPNLVVALTEAYGHEPTPEDIFHYVYAVLYAPAYREKYAEFLRRDFPRIPFTSDAGPFAKFAALGARLTALHLLKSPELDLPACRFEGEGDSRIAKGKKAGLRYEPTEQRVYINPTQYFAPVLQEVWDYQVGGYQVCEKWLKDRRDRRLEFDDIRTYCRIVTALKLTL
ncbi:MAG: type ISP restriction/modification enzyme, partial [Syntrophales bacterium]|nr:type ISP restriction/modification enzyme [Syntrophales bacterium]